MWQLAAPPGCLSPCSSSTRCSALRPVLPKFHSHRRQSIARPVSRKPDPYTCKAFAGEQLLSSLAASPYRDYACLVASTVGALVWVKLFKSLAVAGIMDKKLSRKLVHSTAGPLMVVSWVLYSNDPYSRVLAAVVPALNGLRLALVGSGTIDDPGLVASVSRSGDKNELLGGPFYYCIILVLATLLAWRDNPAGMFAISTMCGGDGVADIVGRRFGSAKLSFNKTKSWAGSAAMLIASALMSFAFLQLFCHTGFMQCYSLSKLLQVIAAISAAATVVEALPLNTSVDDNISVPLVSAALSCLLLPPLLT